MPTITVGQGLSLDEASQELGDGFLSNGLNVRFTNGYARRFSGHTSTLTAPSAAAYHVAPYVTATKNWWIHATLAGAWADDGTTKTDITGTALTGAAGDRFTSCAVGGVYIQNNQVQVPMFWAGDTALNLAALTAWDSTWRCKSIRAWKNYLVALNVTKGSSNYPSLVKMSSEADPGSLPVTWDETDSTQNTQERDLSWTPGKLVDGLELGDLFIAYKDDSAFGMQLTGGDEVFRSFVLPGNHGMLSQNCGCIFPGGHAVMAPGNIYIHNGGEPQSIIDGKMRDWLFNGRLDATYYARSFVVANHARSEIWFCYPVSGSSVCTEALVWNYKGNTFGVRELPSVTAGAVGTLSITNTESWDSDTDAWDEDDSAWDQVDISQADKRVVMSSTASKLYLMDQGTRFDGVVFRSRIERTGLTFGDQGLVKWMSGAKLRLKAPVGTVVYVQAGGTMNPEKGIVWAAPVTYTVGDSDLGKVDLNASGKFLAYRMWSDAGSWAQKSLDFEIAPMGRF